MKNIESKGDKKNTFKYKKNLTKIRIFLDFQSFLVYNFINIILVIICSCDRASTNSDDRKRCWFLVQLKKLDSSVPRSAKNGLQEYLISNMYLKTRDSYTNRVFFIYKEQSKRYSRKNLRNL
jgi:hypothetical protein